MRVCRAWEKCVSVSIACFSQQGRKSITDKGDKARGEKDTEDLSQRENDFKKKGSRRECDQEHK